MTVNTTVDILKYTASPTAKTSGPKASATNSYADKSGNFTSILDTANKNYSAQTNSSNNFNNMNKASTQNSNDSHNSTNGSTNKAVNTKTDTDKTSNNFKTSSQTESAKSSQVQDQADANADKARQSATTAQESEADTKNIAKAIAATESKADADESAVNASEAKTAAADDDATSNAKADSDLKAAIDEKATANATDKAKANADINSTAIANAADEKAVSDKNAIIEANADAAVNKNANVDTNTTATTAENETDTKIKDNSDATNKNEKTDKADKEDENPKLSTKNDGNIQPTIDLTNANLAKAVENIIVSLPQAVNTSNTDTTTAPNSNDNVNAVQPTKNNANQEDIKINLNQLSQLNQATNIKTVASKELSNANIQQNVQQEPVEPKAAQQNTATRTEELKNQNANAEAPVIKVNTEAIASDINLNSHANDKDTQLNTKNNILDKASITQDIIDKTNAKITSVQNASSSDSTSDNLLNKQPAGEQAIKFAIENNSNNNEKPQNVAQPITAAAQNIDLTNIAANSTTQTQQASSTNFAKTLENIQMPVETPKELNKTDILSQINNKLDGLKDEGTSKISIILRPENLGRINLELINSKEGLTAQITADSAHVKELLDKNLDSLKDTLGNQGVNVNNVSVKVAESQKQDSTNYFEQQNQQQNQQQSNNKQTNGNGFSFNEETNNFADTTETRSETEDLVSASDTTTDTSTGKVDYKV